MLRRNEYRFWLNDLHGRDYFKDLSMDGRVIFKWISNSVVGNGLDSSG